MEIFTRLGPFWTIGILANIVLTALAIWWIVRSMRSRGPAESAGRRPPEDQRPGT